MPALDMVRAVGATKRSKFIDIKHQLIKILIREKKFKVEHKPTEEATADIMTKALERRRFEQLRTAIRATPNGNEGRRNTEDN